MTRRREVSPSTAAYHAATKVDEQVNAFLADWPLERDGAEQAWATFIRTVESGLQIAKDALIVKHGLLADPKVRLYRKLKGELL